MLGFWPLPGPAWASGPDLSFDRDIRPILSENCFHCHGPDEKERKAKLRLDTKDGILADLGGYFAVKPGDPQESELFARISSDDPDEQMPPPDSNRNLSPREIALLKEWIAGGAKWADHWTFQPIVRPEVKDNKIHPIDFLVEKRLETEKFKPTPRADRETLIRRLSLDLTGLPPTLEQIDAFLADDKPGAWERLVDRTLASPAYGERMAWDWLAAARYADTNGYQGDRERSMWPWRDWVVKAFNQNLPYDEFSIWQLAGDLLPGATHEQILATGFNRNHMINGEGGRIAEENRVEYVFDMTETMGTLWMGLTLNCARCHDHKFDPLRQRDYYQLFAIFNQTPV
ncbi:MAG TPA: chromosome segregation protein, partial [Opitutae bacterium]|nr:chromosome segregation protein [Opitutae bacterium]